MMDSLELPLDMQWGPATGKTEPLSPAGICFTNVPFADELWPIDEDSLLSCFGIEEGKEKKKPLSTIIATIGQNNKDEEEERKVSAEELLMELIELKEEGQWMNQENVDLSTLTAAVAQEGSYGPAASQFSSQQQQQQQEQLSSIYSAHSTLGTTTPSVSPGLGGTSATNNNNLQYVAATEILFNEIKSICNDFEAAAKYQQLTPPQSPPPITHHHQMYAPTTSQYNEAQQQVKKSNFVYVANAPSQMSLSTLNPFEYAERSFVDLQLQSNECLDKTFVFDTDQDAPATIDAMGIMTNSFAPADNTDQMALDLIDELLRNKTKEVHENYVLVNTAQTDDDEKSLKGRNDAAVRAITSLRFEDDDAMEYCDDSATQFSTPSYGNSLASSPSRSGSSVDSQDDDDWSPEQEQQEKSPKKSNNKLRGVEGSSSGSGKSKRRPYERGGGEVEKKSRKKEQNKNAATRYRQKKKQEVEEILDEESRLKKVNKKLVSQFNDARREMKYLRNLLRDMYKQNDIEI